jgi:hypothetical protein
MNRSPNMKRVRHGADAGFAATSPASVAMSSSTVPASAMLGASPYHHHGDSSVTSISGGGGHPGLGGALFPIMPPGKVPAASVLPVSAAAAAEDEPQFDVALAAPLFQVRAWSHALHNRAPAPAHDTYAHTHRGARGWMRRLRTRWWPFWTPYS